MIKRCSNCFEFKDESEFYRKLQKRQSRCKKCNAEVVRGYARRRKAKEIEAGWRTLDARRREYTEAQ